MRFGIEDNKIPVILRVAHRLIELGTQNRKTIRGVRLEVRGIRRVTPEKP